MMRRLDAWVAQSVKPQTSAQVTISRSVGLSPALGSVLTAQPEAYFGFCVSLSLSLSTSLFQKESLKNF